MLTEDLLIERQGKFTASEASRLMAGWSDKPAAPIDRDFPEYSALYPAIKKDYEEGKRKFLVGDYKATYASRFKVTGDLLSRVEACVKADLPPKPPAGLVSYAKEKGIETLFEVDPEMWSTIHTRRGNEREPECMARLSEATKLKFQYTGEDQIHITKGEAGASCDGLVVDDATDLWQFTGEGKCKSIDVHSELILLNDGDDLLDYSLENYAQVQQQIYVAGTESGFFAAFNPNGKTPGLRFKYFEVARNDKFISVLQNRLNLATQIRDEHIAKYAHLNIEETTEELAA